MGNIKEINVKKNRAYHFFDDMINIKDFDPNLLKIDNKSYKGIDIYNIGYTTIKKIGDCENSNSVNQLYLISRSATGYCKEKKDEKYLILDLTDKYEEVLSGIRPKIQTLNGGK